LTVLSLLLPFTHSDCQLLCW